MNISKKLQHLGRVLADRRWWPFYLQRRFLALSSRERVASMVAARLRPSAALPELGLDSAAARDVAARTDSLNSDGISRYDGLLEPRQAAELCDYFMSKPVQDPYRKQARGFLPDSPARNPVSHIAHHDARDVVLAPYLLAVANRPDILAIASRFLGCKPTLGYLAAWWSYHTELGAQEAENFHRDVDDWRFLKLFIYLTDVGPSNGPHVYVRTSAGSPLLRRIRRFDDGDVRQAFGQENIIQLTAGAGDAFLENTFGIHKGQPVMQGRRLIFQAVYSMSPLPYGPKEPVARADEVGPLGSGRPDPWINRLYLS